MSSPGQNRGACGHAMASLDGHLFCAHCRDKGKGKGTCVESKDSSDCVHCSYTRIARKAGMASIPTASQRISQDILIRWEQTAREATVICNQVASFNRCMFKVQQDKNSQLKTVRLESKGKGSTKSSEALDELQHLMEFNSSITQSAANDNWEPYPGPMRCLPLNSIKHDTLAALHTSPLQFATLFPDSYQERRGRNAYYDSKVKSASIAKGKGRFHPYERSEKRSEGRSDSRPDRQAWKTKARNNIDEGKAKASIFRPDQPRASSHINDNHCSDMLRLLAGSSSRKTLFQRHINFPVVFHVPSATGLPQRKGLSPGLTDVNFQSCQLKYVKGVSSVTHNLCKTCNKRQTCCTKSACRGQTSKLLANLAGSGCWSKSSSNPERGLHPPLSDPAKTCTVSHSHKLLCQSPQEQLPAGGITSAYRQKRCRTSKTSGISGVFQPTIFSPKAQQQVEAHIRSEQIEPFPQDGEIQNGDTGNHQDVPPTRGVGHLNRCQGCLLPYTNTGTVQEIFEISCPGSDIPIQSTALWSVHSTLGVHCGSKRGETDGHTQGYKDPPIVKFRPACRHNSERYKLNSLKESLQKRPAVQRLSYSIF